MIDTPNPDIEAETARMSPEALDGDRIKAPVAAALERAAVVTDGMARAEQEVNNQYDAELLYLVSKKVRALIPTDHAAALEAVREQARCEEREACAEEADSQCAFDVADAIRARGESE